MTARIKCRCCGTNFKHKDAPSMNNTLTPFRGRQINLDLPVYVYRNLHGRDATKYSVRQHGLVVAHTNNLYLRSVDFIVSETGRQKVIKTKRKNVHAFVKGFIYKMDERYLKYSYLITYDPYRDSCFMINLPLNRRMEVKFAMHIYITKNGIKGCNCL